MIYNDQDLVQYKSRCLSDKIMLYHVLQNKMKKILARVMVNVLMFDMNDVEVYGALFVCPLDLLGLLNNKYSYKKL